MIDFKLKWWQLIFYEISLISLGILLGIYFSTSFSKIKEVIIFIFIITAIFTLYNLIKGAQIPKKL